jgi:glutamate mutase epsilon subunit
MPFRLTNAPAMLMEFRNQVFKSYLDKYVVVFVDDILVYSKSLMDHKQHLRNVLQVLRENQLYARTNKCDFWLDKVIFLGHVFSVEAIYVDHRKNKAILKWERPTNMTEI